MIIVQAPLRVSLFGGGTDFPEFFRSEGGCALSQSINKYIFVTVKHRFDDKIRVGWTKTELADAPEELSHELIREALLKTGITHGIEISTMGDIPSAGSGLGSSSTVTVGSLLAMHTLSGNLVSANQLAKEACEIEIDTLKKPIGIQDQYIAAYGGLRFFEFGIDGQVNCQRLSLDVDTQRQFDQNFLLFYTGITRKADTILTEQSQQISSRLPVLRQMKEIAFKARNDLKQGNLDIIGELLHESWLLKKQLASRISNGYIDELYQTARKAGALGGKITGAGGGGFLLLYCPVERQAAVRAVLSTLVELPFKVERDGAKVILNYRHP